ncbi:MAG TPA: ribonuclease H-like YkuK family protein [Candidatus Bathyarchaeia archaeon]|nr:ribonuclease H-like YkuK family protein [Candidatus Bathyarchaeia archaeon]
MIGRIFKNPTLGKLSLTQVSQTIAQFIQAEPQGFYRLVIGSDSQERRTNGKKELSLTGAIVVHRLGKGGRYFYQKQRRPRPPSIREKIYTETLFSLEIAEKFLPKVNKILNGKRNYELEIHIDVGRSGETRDMIKEVVGMVNGNGFRAKTKPDSFGASKVADKHT